MSIKNRIGYDLFEAMKSQSKEEIWFFRNPGGTPRYGDEVE
jgi:hypothetical protein